MNRFVKKNIRDSPSLPLIISGSKTSDSQRSATLTLLFPSSPLPSIRALSIVEHTIKCTQSICLFWELHIPCELFQVSFGEVKCSLANSLKFICRSKVYSLKCIYIHWPVMYRLSYFIYLWYSLMLWYTSISSTYWGFSITLKPWLSEHNL